MKSGNEHLNAASQCLSFDPAQSLCSSAEERKEIKAGKTFGKKRFFGKKQRIKTLSSTVDTHAVRKPLFQCRMLHLEMKLSKSSKRRALTDYEESPFNSS